jgi:hypothetical protein
MSEVKCPYCGLGLQFQPSDSWQHAFAHAATHLDSCQAAESLPIHLRRAIAAGLARGVMGQAVPGDSLGELR